MLKPFNPDGRGLFQDENSPIVRSSGRCMVLWILKQSKPYAIAISVTRSQHNLHNLHTRLLKFHLFYQLYLRLETGLGYPIIGYVTE